jgi:hypothetical protein
MLLVHAIPFGSVLVPGLSWSVLHGVTSQLRVEALHLYINTIGLSDFIEWRIDIWLS